MMKLVAAARAHSQLSWSDVHRSAYTEVHGTLEILSKDFEHGRGYGSVSVADPFLAAANRVNEPPPFYVS